MTVTVYLANWSMADHDFSQDPEEQKKYYRMHMTLLEMLRDRGYNVDDSELLYLDDFPGWTDVYLNVSHLNNIYTNDRDPVTYPPLKVKFLTSALKVKMSVYTEWIQEARRERFNRMIIIGKVGTMTEMAIKNLDKLRASSNLHIEFFAEPELIINITKHSLVPKHEVLSPQDKKEFLEHYAIEEWQLPKIFKNDPVVKYYGVGVGTVLKITRKSETSGRYVTYRIVC